LTEKFNEQFTHDEFFKAEAVLNYIKELLKEGKLYHYEPDAVLTPTCEVVVQFMHSEEVKCT